jgi:hypothetical protein
MHPNNTAAGPALTPRYASAGRQITPLAVWLAEHDIQPLTFLDAALRGCAPRVVRFGDSLFITRADAAAWRDRLWRESVESNAAILAEDGSL